MSGIYLFDRNQKLINTIEEKRLIDPYQELELNSLIRAEFTCKYDKEVEKAYYFGFKDDDNFYLHRVRNIIKKDGFLTDQGVHIMFDELKGNVVRDLRPQNKTSGYALGKALEGTGWTCISHVGNLASTNFYYISALDALYKVCSVWKVEFKPVIKFIDGKISAKEIHLYPSLGNDLGRVFSYGNNLVSVLAETNKDDLYTAFIGRGKGEEIVDEKGQSTGGYGRKIKFTDIDFVAEKDGVKVHSPKGFDYIEIEEATKLYGYPDGTPRITTVDFDNIEDKEELAKATFDFALENSRPKVQLRASGLEIEQVGLGETVTIIADMNIRFKTRVFKIKKNILSKTVVSFEFGDKIIKTTADRLKSAQVEKNNEAVQQIDYMEQVLRAIESTYYNEDGYQYDLKADNEYKLPAGIYSFDRPIDKNPTKVIYLGAGKLMIADSKKEDGSWKFTTAIDGESVNADTIRTGILEGGRVFWNLNDGTFRIGESNEKFSMLWDGETLKLRNVDIDLSNNSQFTNIENNVKNIQQDFRISKGSLESKINSLDSNYGSLSSRIRQTASEVSSKVSKGSIISEINQSYEGVKIKASKIDLEGDVYLEGNFTSYGTARLGYGYREQPVGSRIKDGKIELWSMTSSNPNPDERNKPEKITEANLNLSMLGLEIWSDSMISLTCEHDSIDNGIIIKKDNILIRSPNSISLNTGLEVEGKLALQSTTTNPIIGRDFCWEIYAKGSQLNFELKTLPDERTYNRWILDSTDGLFKIE